MAQVLVMDMAAGLAVEEEVCEIIFKIENFIHKLLYFQEDSDDEDMVDTAMAAVIEVATVTTFKMPKNVLIIFK